jgi:hypothetical protein
VLVKRTEKRGNLTSARVIAVRKPKMRKINGETVYYSGDWIGAGFSSIWHWARSVLNDTDR